MAKASEALTIAPAAKAAVRRAWPTRRAAQLQAAASMAGRTSFSE